MTAFTDAVVDLCNAEYNAFSQGALKEYQKAVYKRVGKYWDALALTPPYENWAGYNGRTDSKLKLDAADEVVQVIRNGNQPWSAAFISWVAREAGAGAHFKYAPSHSVYIVAALKEARKATSTAKFIARRRTDYAPKVGDLIACERRADTDANFDNYQAFVASGRYEAHCDFVVGFNAAGNKVITVGGNVGHSVARKDWPLDANGRIGPKDPKSAAANVICVIETRL
jgi:hypothetical protein